MDKILINRFIGELSKENEKGFYNLALASSDKMIEYRNRANYIFSPNDDLEIILESEKNGKNLNIKNIDLNVKSDSTWKFKVVKELGIIENSYLVSNIEGTGNYIMRLVNTHCLDDDIKEGDELEANVCGFVISANMYPDEETFLINLPSVKIGEKTMTEDGSLMPIHLINNHGNDKGKLKGDDNFKPDDLLVTVKGKLRDVKVMELAIKDNKFPSYFKAYIDTYFGELPIIFNAKTLSNDVRGFNTGFIIVAEVVLSGNIFTDKYKKFMKDSDILKK